MRTIIVPAALSLSGLVAFAQAPAPAASKSVERWWKSSPRFGQPEASIHTMQSAKGLATRLGT